MGQQLKLVTLTLGFSKWPCPVLCWGSLATYCHFRYTGVPGTAASHLPARESGAGVVVPFESSTDLLQWA